MSERTLYCSEHHPAHTHTHTHTNCLHRTQEEEHRDPRTVWVLDCAVAGCSWNINSLRQFQKLLNLAEKSPSWHHRRQTWLCSDWECAQRGEAIHRRLCCVCDRDRARERDRGWVKVGEFSFSLMSLRKEAILTFQHFVIQLVWKNSGLLLLSLPLDWDGDRVFLPVTVFLESACSYWLLFLTTGDIAIS